MNIRNLFSKAGEKIKGLFSNKKKVIAVAAVCATIAAGSFAMQANKSASATATPRFNFLQGDVEMLRAAKTTSSTWGDPINANIGDRVAFILYYHNGMVNTVAHNTRVRVDLPVSQGSTLNMTSYIWSDETPYITDTVVNGQIVGRSGATINLPSNARIQYIPGSTMIFRNGSQTGVQIADGITTNSGVNIGSITGCWEFAGYVTFQADIYGQSNLVMNKQVAHAGEAAWHEEIAANPGDEISYKIGVRNNGDIDAANVVVKDVLPSYMTYSVGTSRIYTSAHPEGVLLPDTLFTTGINMPDVTPGDSGVEYITYKTRVSTSIPAGSWELINTAKVFQSGVEKAQDQAKVVVVANRGLVIDKKVSNGNGGWVEQNSAKLGDEITYRIIVRNTGNIATDSVLVRDILPVYVNYIAGSTKIDGTSASDQIITTGGLNIGNIAAGGQKVVTLRGRIYGCPPVGGYTLTNTGYTWASGITAISDTAVTIVSVSAPIAPSNN